MPTLAELTAAALAPKAEPPAQPLPTGPATAHGPGPVAFSFAGAPGVPLAPGGGPVPPPAALSAPAEPYLTELITSRELASLAAKLVRAKSDDKQSLGRALLHAIRGEPFAPQGQRNKTAFQLAGEIVEEYPNCDPESVLACLSASVSRVAALGSKLTEQSWLSMIERVQDERRGRLNDVKHVTGRIGKIAEKMAARVSAEMPAGVSELTHAINPAVFSTLFILADGVTYLRRPDDTCYRWARKSDRAIQVELARQFGTDNRTVFTHTEKGEPIPLNELMLVYASNADRVVHDYSSEATTWDPVTATLYAGMPSALPRPEFCELVHNWLSAIAGESEDNTRDLYDWIASATREHIMHPAAALVIVGDTGTGKSLLALALAATWDTLPVDLGNTVERFNGSLLLSPFWHADERMPADLTEDKFRKLIQERSRLVEPKGREKVELHGCGRLMFTLNEPDDLRLGKLSGASAYNAIVDRLAYFDCTGRSARLAETLEALRLGPGHPRPYDVDLPRIVRHLRAVQCGLKPRAQRFLGARADKSAARALVLQQGVARNSERALDAMVEYLRAPGDWERSYHSEIRQFSTGQRFPLVTQGQWLWVQPRELAQRLSLVPAEQTGLKQMLKTLRPDNSRTSQITFGNKALRSDYWPVDPEKLVVAANIEPDAWSEIVQTLMVNTRERLPGCG